MSKHMDGMTKIAIAIDPESGWDYPIFRCEGRYLIYVGGAIGMSDPMEFESDVKAIRYLQQVVADGIWDM